MSIEWLDPFDADYPFPPVEAACAEPEGLLAAGGDLQPQRLLRAYRQGIFPWYEEGQPVLWWAPDPRAVLFPDKFRLTRSLRKSIRNRPYTVSFDRAFREVVAGCAAPRRQGAGTWITEAMLTAYCQLHAQGWAHSVEVWDTRDNTLVGGLYGVAIGRIFFGESMFSWATDASKVAMAYLARHLRHWEYALIDCQLPSPHVGRLGAELIPRDQFTRILARGCPMRGNPSPWEVDSRLKVSSWHPLDAKNCRAGGHIGKSTSEPTELCCRGGNQK
ncbi:MAG: leucyl/phenylalanyl-tRNA--protein transferase [Gammaproteobacteria bacterium]